MTEPKPRTQYAVSTAKVAPLVHLRDAERDCVTACGDSISESVIVTALHRRVTCRACVGLIASQDPVLLLEPWLQKAVRKLIECRERGENFGGFFFFRRVNTRIVMHFHDGHSNGSIEVGG
jgi:hypothetical protein